MTLDPGLIQPQTPAHADPEPPHKAACPLFHQISYWLGGRNETVAVKNILIIVNVGKGIARSLYRNRTAQ